MRRFLTKLCLFLFPIVLLLAGSVWGIVLWTNQSGAAYQLPKNTRTLFLGDSHISEGIDDKRLPGTLNLANNAETYLFTYYKLEKLLKHNPQVKQVYLGVGYQNFSQKTVTGFTLGSAAPYISPLYYCLLPAEKRWDALYWNRHHLPIFYKSLLKSWAVPTFTNGYYPYSGGFAHRVGASKAKTSAMDYRMGFHFFENKKTTAWCAESEFYFAKIAQLCQKKQVRLVALSTPLHPYYATHVPKAFGSKLAGTVAKASVPFEDYSQLPMTDDCFLPDGDHLSPKGARLFTQMLARQDFGAKNTP